MINRAYNWTIAHLPKIAGAASFATVLCLGVVLYQTIKPERPITEIESSASASRNALGVAIEYRRVFEVPAHFVGDESRFMVANETGEQVIFPDTMQAYHSGRQELKTTFFLPADIRGGKWCIYGVVQWSPSLSLHSHFQELTPACFMIEDTTP